MIIVFYFETVRWGGTMRNASDS